MQRTVRLLVIGLTSLITVTAHAQGWNWQNPKPNGNSLTTACWIDQNTGWAAGAYGNALKTTDAGITWRVVDIAAGVTFTKIGFSGSQIGLATGVSGTTGATTLRTSDGGATWATVNLGASSGVNLNALTWSGAQVAWLVGAGGTILNSIDGGVSWTKQTSGSAQQLSGVSFINATTGYVCGATATILKTTNGGGAWAKLPISAANAWLRDVAAIDEFNATVVGDGGRIFSSHDKGASWQPTNNSQTNRNLLGISYSDYFHGIAVGEGGTVRRTVDGGTNWGIISSQTTEHLAAVHHSGNALWVAVGNGCEIITSADAGATWTLRTTGPTAEFLGVDFVDSLYGWAAGRNGQVWRTIDGGSTWTNASPTTFHNLNGVSFSSRTHGWVVGDTAYIARTTNGGTTWGTENLPITTKMNMYSVKFMDDNAGWACGQNATYLFRTTNGGATWTTVYTNIAGNNLQLRCVDVNGTAVVVVGSGGLIYHSFNSGTSWIKQTSGTSSQLNGVSFSSGTRGLACGNGGVMLSTTDAGSHWVPLTTGTTQNLMRVLLRPDSLARACGSGGALMRSTDAGETWLFAQPQPTLNNINCIVSPTSRTAFAVGQFGTILKSYQPAAALATSRRAIHFDSMQVNTCDSLVVSAFNTGDTAVFIGSVTLSAIDSSIYSQTSSRTPPFTLQKGESFSIVVRYCPHDTGSSIAALSIVNTSPSNPLSLLIDGYAGALSFTATDSLDFKHVAVADFFDTTARVTNTGTIPLRLKSLVFHGPDSAMFIYNGTFEPVSIAPNDSLELKFLFTPTAPGPRSATAEFATNAGQPVSIFLHGNDEPSSVSAESAPVEMEMNIAPFPIREHGAVEVHVVASGTSMLTCSDLLGRTVWHQRISDGTTQFPLHADLRAGTYLLVLRNARSAVARPLIVVH